MNQNEPIKKNEVDSKSNIESESNLDLLNTEYQSQIIPKILVIISIITILFCFGSLIESLINHRPTFKFPDGSLYKTKIELLGYSSFILYIVGLLISFIALNVSRSFKSTKNTINIYIILVGGAIALSSITLLILDESYRLSWKLADIASAGVGYILWFLSMILDKQNKLIRKMLIIASILLICFSSVSAHFFYSK